MWSRVKWVFTSKLGWHDLACQRSGAFQVESKSDWPIDLMKGDCNCEGSHIWSTTLERDSLLNSCSIYPLRVIITYNYPLNLCLLKSCHCICMDVPHTHANKYAYVVEKLHRYVKRHTHTHTYYIYRERESDMNIIWSFTCIKLMWQGSSLCMLMFLNLERPWLTAWAHFKRVW